MPTKAKRPSKIALEKKSNSYKLLVLFLIFIIAVATYLLVSYSSPLFQRRVTNIPVTTQSQPNVAAATNVPVVSSAESVLGCEFKSSRDSIIYGGNVTFTWNCFSADKCFFNGSEYGPINDIGIAVRPETSRKYQLTCSKGDVMERYEKYISVFEFVMREIKTDSDYKNIQSQAGIVPEITERTAEKSR